MLFVATFPGTPAAQQGKPREASGFQTGAHNTKNGSPEAPQDEENDGSEGKQ